MSNRYGNQLRRRREALGLTQIDLADLMTEPKVSAGTISNVEIGRYQARKKSREAINRVLNELEGQAAPPDLASSTGEDVASCHVDADGADVDVEQFISDAIKLISKDAISMSFMGFTITVGGREITLQTRAIPERNQ